MSVKLLDCTLRDGGYYNDWDFDAATVKAYLAAMSAIKADYVELGFRSFQSSGFKGPYAYTADAFVEELCAPSNLKLGVMINGSELIGHDAGPLGAIKALFSPASRSPIALVRIACHTHEFEAALKASAWLKDQGYMVGYNLMQIADKSETEIANLAHIASQWPIDVLYFADSLGSMNPERTAQIVSVLRQGWSGDLGVHTHDNMGAALANSVRATEAGVTWIDSTVTGMGRGPGNAKTEYLAIELEGSRNAEPDLTTLLALIRSHFKPMQERCGWGSNAFYYLAGKYGIHPTYVQEMLADARYAEEDILAAIEHLRRPGGHKYSQAALDETLNFYSGEAKGSWRPAETMAGRDVLILGNGPGAAAHKPALENWIRTQKPLVIALNTQSPVSSELIDLRAACHPLRLLADIEAHRSLPQPLITPYSMLPAAVRSRLAEHKIKDFGLSVQPGRFAFSDTHVAAPSSIVIAYTLAIAASGKATRILLAGFDGYAAGDPRNAEMQNILSAFAAAENTPSIVSITPSRYSVTQSSVYASF